MSPRAQNPLTLEWALIGLLARKPMHGYDLFKEISQPEGLDQIWHVKQSLLYSLLDKLEQEGLIAGEILPGENRPSRKEYHVTPEGQKKFTQWLTSPVRHPRDIRQEFLARLYLTNQEGGEAVDRLIDCQIEECRRWLENLENRIARHRREGDYIGMVLSYRIHHTLAIIEWLEEVRRWN